MTHVPLEHRMGTLQQPGATQGRRRTRRVPQHRSLAHRRRWVADKAVPEQQTAEQRIVEVLAEAEKPLSQAQIRKRAAARNATVSATLQELIREGRVERASKACYRLSATAVHNAATPQGVIDANGQHDAFPKSFPA